MRAVLVVLATILGLAPRAQADCLIAGDSIAVGLGGVMSECRTNAKTSIPSFAVIERAGAAGMLIVSAGSNDPHNPHLEANLRAIRAKATGKVIWIEPVDRTAAHAVRHVAGIHGDAVVQFVPGPDNVHPKSDRQLASVVRDVINRKK